MTDENNEVPMQPPSVTMGFSPTTNDSATTPNKYKIPTLREELIIAMAERGENINDCITTLTDEELDGDMYDLYHWYNDEYDALEVKYSHYTGTHPMFTVWGPKYVYFPLTYDGGAWIGSAPRFPDDMEKNFTQGGG